MTCPDATGIVHAVTGVLAGIGANITESQQFPPPDSHQFFLRLSFSTPTPVTAADLEGSLSEVADRFAMEIGLQP
ncbi:formyltetrahydrofolate deformylase, partial [Burkholderia multivorans]